ncbi:class I SAM-dependent methyltransferase [Actinomadura logoneensis]|uniref:Class I SAM-dependent methyltransferase n=1 Tax=Actinomadura logoneensis TaxID=2293572 RepID=A0A372JUM0_9ACTN|nr:class I SAM-dependent methyltransferase [Actinomadura logoneensis]RFU43038.1 class I SAM-dependent methyltransferase [Actinomadura logoneensis]
MKQTLRSRFVEGPDSLGAKARRRRWEMFRQAFPDLASLSVIDLGGTYEFWERAPVRPARLHIVNLLEKQPDDLPDGVTAETGDACDLPADLLGRDFDLVVSNSVIEHVGGIARRERFARTVRELAPRHWVQTPYRYFPVEPHWVCPGFQFLPLSARARLAERWPLVKVKPEGREAAIADALGVELLGRTEMGFLFPESEILGEKFAGLVKSLIAVKRG